MLYYAMLMATTMRPHPYLSSTFLWIHAWQLNKIYPNLGKAESAHEMLQDANLKEVEEGYVITSSRTLKVLGDDTPEDKADVVLMIPVESLLDLIPSRLSMPYSGLWNQRFPEKGSSSLGVENSQVSSQASPAL